VGRSTLTAPARRCGGLAAGAAWLVSRARGGSTVGFAGPGRIGGVFASDGARRGARRLADADVRGLSRRVLLRPGLRVTGLLAGAVRDLVHTTTSWVRQLSIRQGPTCAPKWPLRGHLPRARQRPRLDRTGACRAPEDATRSVFGTTRHAPITRRRAAAGKSPDGLNGPRRTPTGTSGRPGWRERSPHAWDDSSAHPLAIRQIVPVGAEQALLSQCPTAVAERADHHDGCVPHGQALQQVARL
jgi:hypothetical protein